MDGKVDQIEDTSIESCGNINVGTLGVPSDPLDVTLEKPGAQFPVSIQHLEGPGLPAGEGGLHGGQGRGTGRGGRQGRQLQVGERGKIIQAVKVGNVAVPQCVCCSGG